VKRIFRLPVLAGGVVMAAVLASLVPTSSSRVYSQVPSYYNPYGQGPYGGYGQGYAASARTMFPSQGGPFGSRAYGYPGYGNVPSDYGNRFSNGLNPRIRVYGKSSYSQPSYGPGYSPFGYRDY